MSSDHPDTSNTPNQTMDRQASVGASAQSSVQSVEANWERQILSDLVQSNLKEQKAARQWKMGLRLGWLLFWLLVLWQVFAHNQTSSSITKPHTALVNIKGEIADGADASAENVVASMRAALEDSGSQALVLLINSPGGSPVQAGIINDEIVRLKALHHKPIYAVVEESCASAAYYIAAATDKIYVDKASIVGSIGVLMDGFGFTGLMDLSLIHISEPTRPY